jgi:hypothetical protein
MVKRSTWIMLFVLCLVVGTYFFVRAKKSNTQADITPTPTGTAYLITPADGTLQTLRINDAQKHITEMTRDTSGNWVITLPSTGPADLSATGAAETQIGALRIVSELANQLNLTDAGLDVPAYTLTLTFRGGAQHVIEVGSLTPTTSGYYVWFDKQNIYVIGQDGIDALTKLILAPPFATTQTPLATFDVTSASNTVTSTPIISTPTP